MFDCINQHFLKSFQHKHDLKIEMIPENKKNIAKLILLRNLV